MSESQKKTHKLFKVAKEFNVGTQSVIDLLARKGFRLANDVNEKLTNDMYELVVKEYDGDRKMKERAEQVKDFHKGMKQSLLQPNDLLSLESLEPLQEISALQLRTDIAEADAKRKQQDAPPAPEKKAEAPIGLAPLQVPVAPVVRVAPEATPTQPEVQAPVVETPVAKAPEVAPEPPRTPEVAVPVVKAEAPEVVAETPRTEAPRVETPRTEAPRTEAPTRPEPVLETLPVPEPLIVLDTTPPPVVEQAPPADEAKMGGLRVVGKVDLDALSRNKPNNQHQHHNRGKDHHQGNKNKGQGQGPKPPQPEVPQLGLFGGGAPPVAPVAKTQQPPATEPRTDAPVKKTFVTQNPESTPVAKTPEVTTPATPETPAHTPPDTEATPPATPTDAPITPPAADTPAAPEVKPEEEVMRANAPQLQGLKVLGKIDLGSHNRGRGKDDKGPPGETEAEKRKRKRKRKRPGANVPINPALGTDKPAAGTTPVGASSVGRGPNTGGGNTGGGTPGAGANKPSSGGGGNKPGAKGGKRREEVSKEEVQNKLRTTLATMGRGGGRKRQKMRRATRDERGRQRDQEAQERLAQESILSVTEFLTANELANLMKVSVNQVIAKCMELGRMVSINQRMEREIIELIAEEFDYEVEFMTAEESFREVEDADVDPEALKPRHPIVTVMGHVDHGKTSLLDYVRKANVISGEAGGITQHIGAYEVTLPESGRKITFLDTPGHEAFTAMRARGAQVTDVAIIVIAADDYVMPQTKEAINHAQAAGVPMVFAINKVDKVGANPEKIKEQLAQMNLLVEDWGGKYQCQHISAKFGQGVEDLLEKVLLESDILELTADPERPARGTVIESELDKGRGVVTTLLVQSGTLKIGDVVLANCYYGRVKSMLDERGKQVKVAGPSTPVQILGLNGVPQAGDKFQVFESDKEARQVAGKREQLLREQRQRTMSTRLTLEQVAAQSKLGDIQELNLIVKGDVDGSVEALSDSLIKLSTDRLKVNIVMKAVGQISESDVLLASASNAIIVGFNVRPSVNARKLTQQENVDVRFYNIIYNAINEIKDALEGMLAPEMREEVLGVAEVRDVFRVSKVGTVAGCKVVDGVIKRSEPIRITRDGIVVFTGKIEGLRRHKDDVREVNDGFECGISIENFNDIKVGDLIESYTSVEVKRTA